MIGKTISHYKILEKLGSGGMGVVYKAQDNRLERFVALKFLLLNISQAEDEKKRFIHEAKAASALDHPNICTIYEIDETEDGQTFIVMACYQGEILKDKIQRGPLRIEDAIDIAVQIAQGLEKAHQKGIVHRDIKPANIFITTDSVVKILDFGLAKLAGRTMLTKEGTTLGTISYMSPEQAQSAQVDHRTDIWSFGVMLYEMVTGQLPFKGDYEQAVMYSIMNEDVAPLTGLRTGVPMELERIVTKCLHKDRSLRYQHADELIADLKALQKHQAETESTSGERRPPDSTSQISTKSQPLSAVTTHRRRIGMIVAVVLLMLIAGISYVFLRDKYHKPANGRQRIVVLPFENLGPPDDAYFADGITEEITSRLASIRSLGVISRNSALHYSGSDKTIKQIGKELRVDYVLEGTVRWARSGSGLDRVRITPKLIRVSDDINVWSDEFDRVISDIFNIQSDIARRIAGQLAGNLEEAEQKAMDARLTDNLDAYHAYLRGKYLARSPHFTVENWRQVEKSYERAIKLDPNFALAYAELAKAHARFIFFWVDISDARRQWAKQAADEALKLASESPKVHLALGYYFLWAQRNPQKALAELHVAEQQLADQTELLIAHAYIFELQGHWEEAIAAFQKAYELSPLDAGMPMELAFAYWLTRRYDLAIKSCDQAIELAPNAAWPYMAKTLILWSWNGATDEARAALQNVSPAHEWVPWMWFWQEIYEGNYQNAIERLKMSAGRWIRLKMWARPKKLLAAFAYEIMNEPQLAHTNYDSARILLEAEIRKWPDDPRYHSSLGTAYAALGQKEKAIAEGKKAVSLLPISKDAFYGIPYIQDLAFIYTLAGDDQTALEQLETLLTIPSWFSAVWLRMDPRWNRLRDLPRFRQLLVNSPGRSHDR